jgi:cobalt-zinc-cadmium efflux system protein
MDTVQGVKNMHHVHVWQLDDHEMMFEAHIDLNDDYSISRFEEILEQIDKILEQCSVHHFNIQPELFRCDQKELINTGRTK